MSLDPDLPFLPPPLRRDVSPLTAVLGGWLLAFAGSLLLGLAVSRLLPTAQPPAFAADGALAIVSLVLFAPAVETLVMAGLLEILRRLMRPWLAAAASAAAWGGAHSLAAPVWGLIIWWPFLVFSALWLVWRGRGFWAAFGIAFACHALHNLLPALKIAAG